MFEKEFTNWKVYPFREIWEKMWFWFFSEFTTRQNLIWQRNLQLENLLGKFQELTETGLFEQKILFALTISSRNSDFMFREIWKQSTFHLYRKTEFAIWKFVGKISRIEKKTIAKILPKLVSFRQKSITTEKTGG